MRLVGAALKDDEPQTASKPGAEPALGDAPRRDLWLRRAMHQFVPTTFHDPLGLTRRLLKTRDRAALFALGAAALGPVLLPFDLLLTPFERARYRRAAPPRRPILIVCGCARSGTTVTAQLLIHRLPVSYLTNLTSVFPRSPLVAEAAIGRLFRRAAPSLHSFYGRTSGWAGPNDALYLWDRWLGSDRTRIPVELTPAARESMIAFFGAREQQTGLATLNKSNALNVCAHLIAEALPTSRFVCIERSRVEHAMSLLKARVEIHGRADVAYGIMPPAAARAADPVEDVCRQVLFHEAIAQEQLARLGPGRFLIAQLDDIARHPDAFVERVARDLLGEPPLPSDLRLRLDFRPRSLGPEQQRLAARIRKTFARLGQRDS
ncbi:MAG: sulfotransferase [Steroidobacteraceae bacterium]